MLCFGTFRTLCFLLSDSFGHKVCTAGQHAFFSLAAFAASNYVKKDSRGNKNGRKSTEMHKMSKKEGHKC